MKVWSLGTALRNPERVTSFLKVLSIYQGQVWNEDAQLDYYIDLILSGEVNPNKVSRTELLSNKMAARTIMLSRYQDAPIRGRVLVSLFLKIGLVKYDISNRLYFTYIANELLSGNASLDSVLTYCLTFWQEINGVSQWSQIIKTNIRVTSFSPFISTLYLIGRVNQISKSNSGLTIIEYNYFAKTIDSYDLIEKFANIIVQSRKDSSLRESWITIIESNVKNFNNTDDYTDNDIKYFLETQMITSNFGNTNLNYSNIVLIRQLIASNIPNPLAI